MSLDTGVVEISKRPILERNGMRIEAGTMAQALSDRIEARKPPRGASLESVTVPTDASPPSTAKGSTVNEAIRWQNAPKVRVAKSRITSTVRNEEWTERDTVMRITSCKQDIAPNRLPEGNKR